MNRTVRACLACLSAILLSAFLSACGGGGGGAGGGPAPPVEPGDTTPPVVTAVIADNGATNVLVTTVVQATFSESVCNVGPATFQLKEASGFAVPGVVTLVDNTAIFAPSANLHYRTTYVAKLTREVTDMAGNALAAECSWSFTTGAPPDTTPPTVNSTTPPGGQTGVAVSTPVRVTFSEAVSNVGPATFQLRDGAGFGVPGIVTHSVNTATFTPSESLAYLTTYTATVTTGVTDLANNALAADYSWSFATGDAQDTTPPTVTSTSPADGATGVAVSARVQAAFSEAVKNVNLSTFQLRAGASAVPGSVTLAGGTAIFTPSADLAYATTYTATLTAGVTDLADNPLAVYNWSFTTGAAPLPCIDCHGGTDGSRPGVNGAPVITRYWQTSGHGKGATGVTCTDCHDLAAANGDHAADGSGTFNTLLWPGKSFDTTNANTAHLKSFFFPVSPVSAPDYAVAFDDACGNRIDCHARAGGGRKAEVMRHALWHSDDPDYLMEFGTHSSIPDPKTFAWYIQTNYADDFYKSQSPWTIADLATDAAGPPRLGTCVSCHDPHGTGTTDNNDAGSNVMLRGNWRSERDFCWLSCHQ